MPSTDKYHPFRYAKSRSFSKRIESFWLSHVGACTVPTMDALEGLQKIVFTGYNDLIERLPFEQHPPNTDLLMDELNRAMVYGVFCAHGRNIFDLDPGLIEMFLNTDVGDVPASSIRLPYETLYLYFGTQTQLELTEGRLVDGAYVFVQSVDGRTYLHIDISTTPKNESTITAPINYITNPDTGFHLAFDISQDNAIDTVLSSALENEIETIRPPKSFREDFTRIANEARKTGIELQSNREEGAARRTNELQERFPVFREAINLAVNALLFLSAYPDENTLEWPQDAPESLTKKADDGRTHKEKRRAESKLLSIGFTRIRFCRLPNRNNGDHPRITPGTVKQHWRRGHWRNQPCGEGRKQRKLIWIRPVIVNSGSDERVTGHIYTVE